MSKKKLICVILVFILFFHCAFIGLCRNFCPTRYIYDNNENITGINLSGEIYYAANYPTWSDDPYPYKIVDKDDYFPETHYILDGESIADFVFLWDSCSFFYYDENKNFLEGHFRGESWPELYVKKGFTFPTINTNKIDEVWMSNSAEDEDNIKDSAIVNKIVECAKSEGEIELDKEIVDYIKNHSWDGHCFGLKYAGYPLIEEFYIEETEDGKYIIDQFTVEEYNNIYSQDEAHK